MKQTKLYSATGDFIRAEDISEEDYFNKLKQLNSEGLFVKKQFNKSRTVLVRSLAHSTKKRIDNV